MCFLRAVEHAHSSLTLLKTLHYHLTPKVLNYSFKKNKGQKSHVTLKALKRHVFTKNEGDIIKKIRKLFQLADFLCMYTAKGMELAAGADFLSFFCNSTQR